MSKSINRDLTSRTQIGRVFLLLCDPVFVRVGIGDWHTLAEVETAVGGRTRKVEVDCPHCGHRVRVEVSNDFYTARNRVSDLKLEVGPKLGFTIDSKKPERGAPEKIHSYRMVRARIGNLFEEKEK